MKRLQTWNFVNFNNAQTLCYPHYPDFEDSRRRLVSKFLLLLKPVLDNLASSSVWIFLIGYIQQCLGWCIAKLDLTEKSLELSTYWFNIGRAADCGIADLYCLLDILAPLATIGKSPSGLQRRPSRQFPNRPDHPHKDSMLKFLFESMETEWLGYCMKLENYMNFGLFSNMAIAKVILRNSLWRSCFCMNLCVEMWQEEDTWRWRICCIIEGIWTWAHFG